MLQIYVGKSTIVHLEHAKSTARLESSLDYRTAADVTITTSVLSLLRGLYFIMVCFAVQHVQWMKTATLELLKVFSHKLMNRFLLLKVSSSRTLLSALFYFIKQSVLGSVLERLRGLYFIMIISTLFIIIVTELDLK